MPSNPKTSILAKQNASKETTPRDTCMEERFDKIKRCCFRKYGNGDSRFKVLKPLIEDLLKAKEKQVERKLDNILREYRNRLKIGNISEANVRRITMVINKVKDSLLERKA